MHPVVKIVSLLVLSLFLTQGEWYTVLLAGILILPFYIGHLDMWRSAVYMLYRLKWLFFSILLIYFFFTPTLSPEHSDLHQSIDAVIGQIIPGLFRVSVLILIVFAVNLFLKTTSKEQILAALLWMFYPFTYFKIDINRVSIRAVLTLEYIEILTKRLAEYKQENKINSLQLSYSSDTHNQGLIQKTMQSFLQNKISKKLMLKKEAFVHLIKHSGIILCEILEEAEKTSGKIVVIDCLGAPSPNQFMIPFLLSLFFYLTL